MICAERREWKVAAMICTNDSDVLEGNARIEVLLRFKKIDNLHINTLQVCVFLQKTILKKLTFRPIIEICIFAPD